MVIVERGAKMEKELTSEYLLTKAKNHSDLLQLIDEFGYELASNDRFGGALSDMVPYSPDTDNIVYNGHSDFDINNMVMTESVDTAHNRMLNFYLVNIRDGGSKEALSVKSDNSSQDFRHAARFLVYDFIKKCEPYKFESTKKLIRTLYNKLSAADFDKYDDFVEQEQITDQAFLNLVEEFIDKLEAYSFDQEPFDNRFDYIRQIFAETF